MAYQRKVPDRIEAGAIVLDVREPDEYDQGALPGAIHIPRGHLESQVESRLLDKDAEVVIYCAGGVRSAFAAKTLQELGYTDVASMAGGFGAFDAGLGGTGFGVVPG